MGAAFFCELAVINAFRHSDSRSDLDRFGFRSQPKRLLGDLDWNDRSEPGDPLRRK
jgi:hypothetical protein